jgi:2-C-methyl-D-erythritol 4-phosphate cytidylyltransferase
VDAVLDALEQGASAVVPGLPVVDTVRQVAPDGSSHTLDRSTLRAVQTPQGFAANVLRRAHAAAPDVVGQATDDAGMVEALGEPITIVAGDPQAMKVTTPLDLTVAGQILAERGGPQSVRRGSQARQT